MLKMTRVAYLTFPFLGSFIAAGVSGCGSDAAPTESTSEGQSALTAAQCDYFDVNGTIQICHELGNGKFKILRLAEQACVNAHGSHATDYVTSIDPSSPLYDPTCNGQGCLPEGAPCDATIEPCDGLVCQNGTVVALPPEISSFTLAPESHEVDKTTYGLDNAVGPDGNNDGVFDLVVRGDATAIAMLFAYSDGTCFPTGQYDTIVGDTSLLPSMTCGGYTEGSNTYGLAVSDDGGATMLNGATGELPSLGGGTHTLKVYIPDAPLGRPIQARVRFADGTELISANVVTPDCHDLGCPAVTGPDADCGVNTCTSQGACERVAQNDGASCGGGDFDYCWGGTCWTY